jgi:flagellar M-ring protein FliF
LQTKLKGFWEKIKGFFAKLNKKTRILLGVCAAVILVLIVAAALLLNRKEYASLCTGLTVSETSSVISFLNENGVTDYKISGDSILVPAGREEQLQIQLVTSRTLNSGFFYETYFNKVGTFSTEAERREAMRIATQEKLEAMIRQLDGIRDAQVVITLSSERVYVLDPQTSEATATVLVTPDGNQLLSAGTVESIRYMVSHAVKDLNVGDVTISDTNNNVYNDTTSGMGQMADANALKLQYEQSTNNQVRLQVLNVLEPIYGKGNVSVAVNTTVDMSRKVVESTKYAQPEGSATNAGLIGEERWFWVIGEDGTTAQGGTVGTSTNSDIPLYPDRVPNGVDDAPYSSGDGERKYLEDKEVTQREVFAGTITDLKVAVSINQDARNSGSVGLEQLTRQVAVAAGIGTDPEVMDNCVNVLIAPFNMDTPANGPDGFFVRLLAGVPDWMILAAIGGLILFIILLIIILLLRRRAKKKRLAKQAALEAEMRAAEEAAAAEAAAAVIAAAPTGGADIMEVNTEKSMELRKAVRQFAQNNPEIAAQMVKTWLKGEDGGA